ncbi:MAG: purine-cytosine permease family protein [Planctomycetota bacterium]|jgi:NCS1 family nucleobase:cation symporter-1
MAESRGYGLIERLDKLNEFERQPVTADKLESGRHFAGVFAGEHVAATEFVIGALFVSKGARTCDVIVGLILGNLLAVLSWALICAPIAVRTRLTLYWYLRKIGGPVMMVIYNILNAIMYCILAGAMITVSASALRIPFGIPDQVGWFPTDIRFVFIVMIVGAVVVTLAILGFRKLAQFAEVCSPWMFLMFIAGAFALFPAILASMPEVKSVGSFFEFWNVADAKIWPGPQPGQEDALGFLHIVSFAWICNLAMHVGLSDMALLRYARRASYGFYSAFGMYLGHYLAWICAGIMGAGAATIIGKPLAALDSGSVAYTALGVTGALAVVIAGWTTANPTIYRAGLALQVVTPNWPRWLVTLFAGAVTTVVACSPFVFTKLLDFVGLYGLLLMPVGAIVFVEHWIFPRIGIAWFVSLSAAVVVWLTGMLHLFFLLIPVWFVTAVLYIVLCYMCGARRKAGEPVGQAEADEIIATDSAGKPQPSRVSGAYHTWGVLALAALVGGLVIAIMVARAPADIYEARLKFFKQAIACLTVVYFVTAIVWMTAKEKGGDKN